MNLKFELRKQWTGEYKTNFVKRYLARRMAKSIFKDSSTHYQMSGWTGSLKKEYVMCLASKYQLMHWILFNAGYSCSVAHILERCGINYTEWEKQEMGKSSSDCI